MNLAVKVQKDYIDLLRKQNLLELALAGKLPPNVEKAAKQFVIMGVPGVKANPDMTEIHVSAEDHEEAERELNEMLLHYKVAVRVEQVLRATRVREFERGKKYAVLHGAYSGLVATYRGTDVGVYGVAWLDNFGHPACEKYLFRMQRDRIPMSGRVCACEIDGKPVILHERELGDLLP